MPGRKRSQISRANASFRNVLSPDRLQAGARRAGFIQRQRIADASSYFWALVVTLGSQSTQYLSDVLRTLNCQQGWSLRYKPFWNRLSKPAFPRFMRETFQRLCTELVVRVVRREVKSAASYFSDIFLDDGCSFGLADGLRDVFPGRFTKIRPAAVELHARMSLFQDQLASVSLAPDTRGEREFTPAPEALPKRSLSIRDRGFLDLGYFEQLEGTEAFLICRSPRIINPILVKMRGVGRSYASPWEGKALKDIPQKYLKAASDLVVAFNRPHGEQLQLRLVVRELPPSKRRLPRHPRKEPEKPETTWLYLLTNLPDDKFSAEDIQQLYRLRWQIELAFKDWKSYANLHALQSENPAIVEGVIWASLCAAFIKRSLAHWAQLVCRRPISTRIAAQAGPQILNTLAAWAREGRPARILKRILDYLAQNAQRAHPNRDKLRPQQAVGLHFGFT